MSNRWRNCSRKSLKINRGRNIMNSNMHAKFYWIPPKRSLNNRRKRISPDFDTKWPLEGVAVVGATPKSIQVGTSCWGTHVPNFIELRRAVLEIIVGNQLWTPDRPPANMTTICASHICMWAHNYWPWSLLHFYPPDIYVLNSPVCVQLLYVSHTE